MTHQGVHLLVSHSKRMINGRSVENRIVENENASVTESILGINSYDAILVTVWCCLPVNYLLSSLCNWLRLVSDWFKLVLHNTYCLIYSQEKNYFPFAYQFQYKLKLT